MATPKSKKTVNRSKKCENFEKCKKNPEKITIQL